jgi:uncharacterized protein with FMN-binding domain
MGFLSKLAKGVKKVVKKIGSGIKSAVKSVGKFMGKIGIVGQIAMAFILPGIGSALMKGLGTGWNALIGKSATFATAGTTGTLTAGTGMLGSSNAIIRGAGHVLKAAGNFVKAGHSAFKTVTSGIGSFVKEFTGTALKKIPGMEKLMPSLKTAPDSFFGGKGTGSAWDRVSQKVMTNGEAFVKDFNKAIGYTPPTEAVTAGTSTAAKTVAVVDSTVKDVVSAGTDKTVSLLDAPTEVSKVSSSLVDVPDIVKTAQSSAIDAGVTAVDDKGFFEKLYDSGKAAVESIPDKIIEAPSKFVDNLDDTIQSGLKSKVLIKTGLQDEPVYTTVYEGSVVVPEMGTAAYMGQYGSSEINDRAYQMSVNPSGFSMSNPWGSPANTYQQELGARYG